jgi:hypothetical protein
MRTLDFRVTPVAGGWMVEGPGLAPLVVRSGGRAELKAETLAKAMTAAGVDTRVIVFDREGTPVGTKRFWAQEPPAQRTSTMVDRLVPA